MQQLQNMSDFQLKIYVGGRKHGARREANIRALALRLFPKASGEGNISALFNYALNKVFNLDPDTGDEIGKDIGMVAEGKPKPYGDKIAGRNSKK